MGLDMYLTKRTYVWTDHKLNKRELHPLRMPKKYSHIKPERIKEVCEEVGYWRKANHIHMWFVENVQDGKDDCGEYFVSKENLEALLSVCKMVKSGEAIPEEVLPRVSGFFFGSTDYDEYYMIQIEQTIQIVEDVLMDITENGYLNGDITYKSSW